MEEVYFFDSVLDKCDFSQDNLGGETDLSATHFVNSCQRDCKFGTTKQAR